MCSGASLRAWGLIVRVGQKVEDILHHPWTPYIAVLGILLYTFNVSEEARDQTCYSLEREHKAEVHGLKITYQYLDGLTIDQRKTPINRLVVQQLPQTTATATEDPAPEFCDGGSLFHGELGLPEPDPVIPTPPADAWWVKQ